MKGDLVCEKCDSYSLQVIYKRDSVGDHNQVVYGQGRRKQKFVRLGVLCNGCGWVFLDKEIFLNLMKERKDRRKRYSDFPKGKPGIKVFVKYRRTYFSDKPERVKES